MDGGFDIPWVGESKYHGYVGQETMYHQQKIYQDKSIEIVNEDIKI
jgi:hypothetical protein